VPEATGKVNMSAYGYNFSHIQFYPVGETKLIPKGAAAGIKMLVSTIHGYYESQVIDDYVTK
jgi:hypothetical protein